MRRCCIWCIVMASAGDAADGNAQAWAATGAISAPVLAAENNDCNNNW